jgi:hypothetical protein
MRNCPTPRAEPVVFEPERDLFLGFVLGDPALLLDFSQELLQLACDHVCLVIG